MKILTTISIGLIVLTTLALIILEKKEKIKPKNKMYRIMEFVGFFIPVLIICGNYAYMRTDALNETIIAVSGIYVCIILWFLFLKIWRTNKYNYIIFPIVVVGCCIIIKLITPYMLSSLHSYIASLLGATIGVSFVNNKYKKRLIVSEIIVCLVVLAGPFDFLSFWDTNNKVENISLEYVQKLGYEITDDDKITILGKNTRNEPINLLITRIKSKPDLKVLRNLKLVYLNGEIIEFQEII